MRVVDYIAKRLRFLGISNAYMVTGGAAMHLNDAISREFGSNLHFLHHEQSCSMAAESFARITNQPCLVNVTAGPGSINAINGVFGAYVDSLPMIILSGQSKRETLVINSGVEGLRQLGDQEVNIVSMVSSICKSSYLLQDPLEIADVLDNLYLRSITGRPGPIWIDIPIDVQAYELPDSYLPTQELTFVENNKTPIASESDLDEIASHLINDNRPVLFVGSGIRTADAYQEFLEFLDKWPLACVTGWNSNDLLWDEHPSYSGRPGSVGNRTGNFAVQFSSCLLVVGCRLNIRQISYNWDNFAQNSWLCHVDIDSAELSKPTLNSDLKVNATAKGFFPALSDTLEKYIRSNAIDIDHLFKHWYEWRSWLRGNLSDYPVLRDSVPSAPGVVNPYRLVQELSLCLPEGSVTVCSDGTACVAGFQATIFKKAQRMFHNSGCASMGYELPAAIGAYHATHHEITCLAGDGSIMMNLQELAIIGGKKYPIKIILLNNGGYHSIRQTQANYFADNPVGCGVESGLPFPSFSDLCKAFGISYLSVSDDHALSTVLSKVYLNDAPFLLEVVINQDQQFAPKLSSRRLESGEMVTASLEDMSPHLPEKEINSLRKAAHSINL